MTEHKNLRLIHIRALASSCVQLNMNYTETERDQDSLGVIPWPPIRIPQPQLNQSGEGRQVEGRHSTHLQEFCGMTCAGVQTCTRGATPVCRDGGHVMGKGNTVSSAGRPAEPAWIHISTDTKMTA